MRDHTDIAAPRHAYEACVDQIRQAGTRHTRLHIRGGGSKSALASAVARGAGESLDTRALSGIGSYEPSELVVTALGGTPLAELEAATMQLAVRIAGVPRSHLAMHKMVVNQVLLTMGLEQSQMMATMFDGITRHNPEGLWFRRYAQQEGFKAAVQWRDSGRPIPERDEARALIAAMDEKRRGQG